MKIIKKLIISILSYFGYGIQTGSGKDAFPYSRNSQIGIIKFILKKGLKVGTVIDIGAADGTESLLKNFKNQEFVLIEPNELYLNKLIKIANKRTKRTFVFQCLLYSEIKKIKFFEHFDDPSCNTIYEEQEEKLNNSYEIRISNTLDNVMKNLDAAEPYFIKLDTQGSELDILMGSIETIKKCNAILIEVSLYEFFKKGPLIADIFKFMKEIEFKLYDVADLTYRPIDGALAQFDLLFVRNDSRLFSEKRYSNR